MVLPLYLLALLLYEEKSSSAQLLFWIECTLRPQNLVIYYSSGIFNTNIYSLLKGLQNVELVSNLFLS
jgi:hypothetical protein